MPSEPTKHHYQRYFSLMSLTRACLTDKLYMNVTFAVEDLAAAADAAVAYSMDGDTRLRAKR
jgi:hypothetical protein